MVRTTVVGSYPRVGDTPEEQRLRRAIARSEEGKLDPGELRSVELDVIREVVGEQVSAGIDLPTDGQVTWYDSQSHFASRLDGFAITGLVRYFDTNTYYRQPRVTGAIRWRGPITLEDWRSAAGARNGPLKAVVTGPFTLAALASNGKSTGGPVLRELAAALGQEVRTLAEAGATHIQVDEPAFTGRKELPAGYARATDDLLAGKGRAETTLFTFFGGVGPILPELLELPFDVVGLDLVQGANTLAALRRHESPKPIALGLVDARNTRLEDPAVVAKEALSLADHVPLERSYISPSNGLEFLPRAKAREKLRVLAAAAGLVAGGG